MLQCQSYSPPGVPRTKSAASSKSLKPPMRISKQTYGLGLLSQAQGTLQMKYMSYL